MYNIHEAVGFQAVCISLSGDLDGTNVTITVMSSTDGATAQGKCQTSLDHTTKEIFCAMQIFLQRDLGLISIPFLKYFCLQMEKSNVSMLL